jgi:uncharacterized protein (TIGR02679 family)
VSAHDRVEPLRAAALDPLWDAARTRLERNGHRLTSAPLRLSGLGGDEVEATCALLGRRRPRGDSLDVDLRELDRTLRAAPAGLGLVDVLEVFHGPLRDRRAERDERARRSQDLWIMAAAHPAGDDRRVRKWLETVRRRGRLIRLDVDDPADVLRTALDAIEWLVEHAASLRSAPIPLSTVAAGQFGEAHALDPDTAVGAFIADGLEFIAECEGERAAWAAFGIQLDQVSSSALVLGLPGVDGSLCAAAEVSGQPLRVTWRMIETGFGLDRESMRAASPIVRVCENPAIVSMAADRLGSSCAPLVCTEGMPGAVSGSLLAALESVGADLRVHTDFDFGGMSIARHVIDRFGAAPWKLGRASYLRAIEGPTSELVRSIGETPWDPGLAEAMNEHRLAVHEEAIAPRLLDDLGERSTI